MKKLFLIILIFNCFNLRAVDYYDFNKRLILAQENIANLKLKSAENLINEELRLNPENLASLYYQNYIDCYKVLISQDKNEYNRFKTKVELRIEKFEKWNTNSSQKQIVLSQLELQFGFAKILFNEYIGAALSFRTAFKYTKSVYEQNRENLVNQKNYGLLYASIGTFPEQYKWVLRSIGLEGNFKEGIQILGEFIQKTENKNEYKAEHMEALFAYSYLMLNFGKSKKATWEFIKNHTNHYSENLSEAYLRALTAEKCYHSEECIKVISKRPLSSDFEQLNIFDYLLGSAKLNLLEMDGDVWLKKYVTFSSSNFQKKDAYRKLSWHALILGNSDKFLVYRNLSLKNNSSSPEESIVSKDIEFGQLPNKNLIKARLLYDGGNFKKSIQICQIITTSELKSTYQKIELEYRLARNFQELEMDANARFHYKNCLSILNPPASYLLPNSCLQLAYIYEKSGDINSAKTYYNKVLLYKNYEYKQSIHQEAKNGLATLKLMNN